MKKFFFPLIFIILILAAMTITSSAYTSVYGEEITGCVEIERTDWFDFSTYPGVATDGSADVTAALQACVDEHDNVFLPKGTYRLDNQVRLHSGNAVHGEDGTVINTKGSEYDGNYRCFTFSGTYDAETELLTFAENISIKNLVINCETLEKRIVVISCGSVRNLIIENVKAYGICLCWIGNTDCGEHSVRNAATGSHMDYYCNGVTIRDCVADGINYVDIGRYLMGIAIEGINNFIIEDNEIYNYTHGIQFYGGVSDILTDDNYENRFSLCGNVEKGIFRNNKVGYMSGAGIWGTCASNVILEGNTIEYCIDGSIDFEASYDCLVENNHILNGLVGGSTAAMGEIVYRGNEFKITADWNRDYFSLHGNPDSDYAKYRQRIVFENNTFIAEGQVGTINATHYNRAGLAYFVFRNNTCINTVLRTVTYYTIDSTQEDKTAGLDLWEFDVENNTFDFDIAIPWYHHSAIYAITGAKSCSSTKITVTGNKITSSVAGATTEIYISNEYNGDNFGALVTDNTVDKIILKNVGKKPCGLILKNNSAEKYELGGGFAYIIRDNENQNRITFDSLVKKTVSENEKAGENEYSCPALPEGYGIAVNGSEDTVWKGCEENLIDNIGISEGKASFKALWYPHTDGKQFIAFLINVEKGSADFTGDILDFTFENGGVENHTVVKLTSGDVQINDSGCHCQIFYTALAHGDGTGYTVEMKFFPTEESTLYQIIKDYDESERKIGFKLSYKEKTDKTESTADKLGTLIFIGSMRVADTNRSEEADYNGDGIIDSRDLILMKQYLARANYRIEVKGASADSITSAALDVVKAVIVGIDVIKNSIFGIS